MIWRLSWRADPVAKSLADRHYNRQNAASKQFVPPGRCLVLRSGEAACKAVWVTSWPFAEYVRHAWGGAWMNSLFRNEGAGLSSELIRQAVAATRANWPDIPSLGMVTFVDPTQVRSSKPGRAGRHRGPGYCYRKAGFRHVGETKGGKLAFQLLPADMPAPECAQPSGQLTFAEVSSV